jgi:hypothetical protein
VRKLDVEHSEITRIQRTGYPNGEYLLWESQQQEEADEEVWPDGLRYAEWQNKKRTSARMNA